jgi:ABC-2 type transport system ATP-binding protein
MINAFEIEHLSKHYGKICAVNNISLDIPKGTIYGLVGPNGAGKTTLIKALVGSLKPSAGRVTVLGLDPILEKWKLREQIGYMPQSPALYEDLTARDNIRFFGGTQRIPGFEKKVDDILQFTELTNRANDLIRTFSGGMKKRVSLCCALIHQPKIVFLDEPTAAIDPHLKLLSWNLFRQIAKTGVTLVISTHLMDEALLCDKVTVLRKGKIIAVDSPSKILERGKTIIQFREKDELKKITIDSTPENLASALQKMGLNPAITSISFQPDNIEDIVLGIIGEKAHQDSES